MLPLAGKTIGKTIRFVVSLAKSLEEDPERSKRIARISLKMVLPEVAKRLIPNPALRSFFAKAINWDFLLDLILGWFFDKIVAELDLDRFLREILDEVQDFLLETSFRLAITFAMHAAGVNVAVRQLGKNVYLLYLAGPKGKRVVLSFRF